MSCAGCVASVEQAIKSVDGVLLANAAASFECIVESEMQSGDHVIFVGTVVASHVNSEATTRRLYALDRTKAGFRLGGVREHTC